MRGLSTGWAYRRILSECRCLDWDALLAPPALPARRIMCAPIPTRLRCFSQWSCVPLTLQREDLSVANLISCGLFGDGAAAVLIAGDKCGLSGPKILASRSVFYPETEEMMV